MFRPCVSRAGCGGGGGGGAPAGGGGGGGRGGRRGGGGRGGRGRVRGPWRGWRRRRRQRAASRRGITGHGVGGAARRRFAIEHRARCRIDLHVLVAERRSDPQRLAVERDAARQHGVGLELPQHRAIVVAHQRGAAAGALVDDPQALGRGLQAVGPRRRRLEGDLHLAGASRCDAARGLSPAGVGAADAERHSRRESEERASIHHGRCLPRATSRQARAGYSATDSAAALDDCARGTPSSRRCFGVISGGIRCVHTA